MTLVLINGISTAGKSTIARELAARGYDAYDTERDGISGWFNKETGERVAEFGKVPERTKEWMDAHEFRMSMDWVNDKYEEAKNKTIYVCGAAANGKEVRKLCDVVIWLQTDEATIRERLKIPREHTYGTHPHEFARILEGNVYLENDYAKYGAKIIDARQPLASVVDMVISFSEDLPAKHP